MNDFIRVTVLNFDHDDFQFRLEAENGLCRTTLDFYGYDDVFSDFGKKLIDFPKSIDDKVTFELGEDNRKWAYYMLIEAFCFDQSGHTALKIVVDNMSGTYHGHRTEFTLRSEAASLNTLGQILIKWNPLETKEVFWESFAS